MFFVYFVTNKRNGTIYTGHTDNIGERVIQHKKELFDGFTKRYGCKRLIWFELHDTRDSAFKRERQIKKRYRHWKIEMLEELNPDWDDLSLNWTHESVFDPRREYIPPTAHSGEQGNPDDPK